MKIRSVTLLGTDRLFQNEILSLWEKMLKIWDLKTDQVLSKFFLIIKIKKYRYENRLSGSNDRSDIS